MKERLYYMNALTIQERRHQEVERKKTLRLRRWRAALSVPFALGIALAAVTLTQSDPNDFQVLVSMLLMTPLVATFDIL
jgi:hypothetical protein